MDKTAARLPPAIGVVATDDDHISRYAQGAMEPHRLLSLIGNLGLDHEEVDVAV